MSENTPVVKKATKKPAAKKPSDRQVKETPKRPEDTPGWSLMRSFDEIPVWEQMPLIAMLHDALDDSEVDEMSKEEFANLTPEERKAKLEEQGEERDFDIRILGELSLKLRDFAVDADEYTKFCSGKGALERSLNLAMAWVGQMGEFSGSENS